MKIAFDAKRFFNNNSGLGNYSRDFIRILANYFPENEYILLAKKESKKGKEILKLPNIIFHKLSNGLFSRQLKMGIDAQSLDAKIFHGLSGELPLRWKDKNIKKVVTIHDLIFMRFPQFYSWFDRKIHFWKFKNAAIQADVIIAISEQTKKDIIHYLKVPESKIKVVYQGCHTAFKEDYSQENLLKIKEKFGLPKRFILNVGTIEERKNLLSVVKALKNNSIPLVVIGKKTNYFKSVETYIQNNKIEVYFLNNVSMIELAGIYKLADIFIYPSIFEGFGIPIIEAHYSQVPVITSNTSCLPEAGGEHALYVNPLNVEDIKEKIVFLWENESERKKMVENSQVFVQKFNDEKIAKNIMEVYNVLIKK